MRFSFIFFLSIKESWFVGLKAKLVTLDFKVIFANLYIGISCGWIWNKKNCFNVSFYTNSEPRDWYQHLFMHITIYCFHLIQEFLAMTVWKDWREKSDVQVHTDRWDHPAWLDFKEMLDGMELMVLMVKKEWKVIHIENDPTSHYQSVVNIVTGFQIFAKAGIIFENLFVRWSRLHATIRTRTKRRAWYRRTSWTKR